jgi:hypothetical protein
MYKLLLNFGPISGLVKRTKDVFSVKGKVEAGSDYKEVT